LESHYLDLLKKTLLGEIYWENEARILYLRNCIEGKDQYDAATLLRFPQSRRDFCDHYQALRKEGRFIDENIKNVGYVNTMVGRKRLENVERCLDRICKDGVPGDLIECGVWRGGCAVFLRGYMAAHRITDRNVWVADSFVGVPPPSLPQDDGVDLSAERYPELAIPIESVRDLFARYGLLDDRVRFLHGWFRETLPKAPIGKLALLRIDADLYESTSDALSALYSRLCPGGFAIIDDYGCISACREAVDDYRSQNGIEEPIVEIDWTGVFWRKAANSSAVNSATRSSDVFA
jgi:hypothetical protein